ncbi:MAG: urease accessory protein UreD [Chitinophagaceae bacterium]
MALNASLHIQTTLRDDKSILKKTFCTPPFKVADITEDKRQHRLELMLMSSSPGMLDGDAYEMQIDVGENSSLQLTTQSYQRLFRMKTGVTYKMSVQLESGASFSYLPHPGVPHENSNYSARNKIYLSKNCTLLWGEIISCGRKLNGEVFRFSQYHSITEVFVNGRLSVKENLLIRPADNDVCAIGAMEGYTHQATLMYINETTSVKHLSAALNDHLVQQQGIAFGITALPVKGILIRVLGHKGEQLFDCIKSLAALIEQPAINSTVSKPIVYAG